MAAQASCMSARIAALLGFILLLGPSLCVMANASADAYLQHVQAVWQRRLQHKLKQHPELATGPLSPLLKHNFSLTEIQLRKGMAYVGANYRLRKLVGRMLRGEAVKIGVIGGSTSAGTGAEPGKTDWFTVFGTWLRAAFPKASIMLRNGAVHATPSSYMAICLNTYIDPDVNLLFMEYTTNDNLEDRVLNNGNTKSMERLIRKAIDRETKPALVFLNSIAYEMLRDKSDPVLKQFYHTPEDLYGSLAQYYDVQWLSWRDSIWHERYWGVQGLTAKPDITIDYIHPSELGHRMLADLAIYLVQETVFDLMQRPISDEELSYISRGLPDPMYPGNNPVGKSDCMQHDQLQSVLITNQGWELKDEGKPNRPKVGFVSTTVGSVIEFKLDTIRAPEQKDKRVEIYVSHLKSYEKMGMAELMCAGGCKCDNQKINGHQTFHDSQTFVHRVAVSQAADCVLRFTVSQETQSGEHKFKIIGLIVSDGPEGETAFKMPTEYNVRIEDGGFENMHELTNMLNKGKNSQGS